jgi:pimeloyl-ACP methyl ester carboxylesterase
MRKKLLWIGLGVAAALLAVPAVVLGPYALRVRRFPAEPGAGYHADFFVYVSPGARRAARRGEAAVLLVQPNNSGTNADDPGVHRRDAWWTGFERQAIADRLEVVLLVPAFVRPAKDWRVYTHALDRDVLTTARTDLARLDLQLLAMVDRARATLAEDGLPTEERFLLQGFSASGMFANRFAALHPERVRAVAAGSPGGWPIAPLAAWGGEPLPYPAGIADLAELTGRPFDAAAYRSLPQLLVLGSLDTNDSLDFRDGWDEEPAALVDRLFGSDPLSRWEDAEAVYRAAGADARFLLVEGVGHDRKALQDHSTRFFGELLGR